MELRSYQQESINSILSEWEQGHKRTLLVLPTGCGKTVVFTKLTEELVRQGKRVLILAHRSELLEQAADKLKKVTGLGASVEKAEQTSQGSWYRVTVGSVQTLQRDKRLEQFPKDYWDVIIVDEAHHILADGYQKVMDYFDCADVLGVTATPDRSDKQNLGKYFDSLAYEYSLIDAIKSGYLSKMTAMTIPLKLDISKVSMSAGDFKASEVGTALDPYLEQIADEMVKQCSDRKTVVFLPLVKTSKKFRDILNAKGFKAAEVNGESEDRVEILEDFDKGKYNVLCNSMLLTEGWDCPSVDCVIVLRPTKSRSLLAQMVGRGTRLAPGKENLLILDFLWHTERHELCRPAHLITDSPEVAKKMVENMAEQTNQQFELLEAEETANKDVVAEREEALAKQLSEMRKRKGRLVDPLQFEMSIQAEDLADYVPAFGIEMSPPTDKQIEALEKFGIATAEIGNFGKASKLLDRLSKRKETGLTTPKQIRLLERYGFKNVGMWRFEQASNLIVRIQANGWRVPRGIRPAEFKPE